MGVLQNGMSINLLVAMTRLLSLVATDQTQQYQAKQLQHQTELGPISDFRGM